MQKQEFEERIERTVTDEQYKVIEEVYMWHPSIRNTSGKDEVAELYKSFGMTIFHDMLPRAKKAHELDELLRNAQREVQGGLIMAEQSKDILSEYTKDITPEQRAELQEKVSNMTEEELKEFRNSLDPDSMGFFGEESV